LQCVAIKTAVAFSERAAKSTVPAAICHRTQSVTLCQAISSCHCIVLNMAPSTSIEIHKAIVRWCLEQHKTLRLLSIFLCLFRLRFGANREVLRATYSRLHIKLPTYFGEILCPDQITWLLVPRSAELIFFRLDCDRESQN
jgi:hypothetical protein